MYNTQILKLFYKFSFKNQHSTENSIANSFQSFLSSKCTGGTLIYLRSKIASVFVLSTDQQIFNDLTTEYTYRNRKTF